MGQYHYLCNLDKHEYLHPHKFGDGLKLLEFGCSADGTMTALACLLASSNGRGGGDLHSENPLIGSWSGDRIAIIGDYNEPEDVPGFTDSGDTPWDEAKGAQWVDISADAMKMICEDSYVKSTQQERAQRYGRSGLGQLHPSD